MNYENPLLYTDVLSPPPLAQQGQSSSSPHPVSILFPPASCTFHDTPRSLLGLSQSRKTPSLKAHAPSSCLPSRSLLILLSRGQTELHLLPSRPHLTTSTSLKYGLDFFQPSTLTPAGQRQYKKEILKILICSHRRWWWQEVTDRCPEQAGLT